MPTPPISQKEVEKTIEVFTRNGGNLSATARELKLARQTVQTRLRKAGANNKPLAAGTVNSKKNERVRVVAQFIVSFLHRHRITRMLMNHVGIIYKPLPSIIRLKF